MLTPGISKELAFAATLLNSGQAGTSADTRSQVSCHDSSGTVFVRPAPFDAQDIKNARPLQLILDLPKSVFVDQGHSGWVLTDSSHGVCHISQVLIDTSTQKLSLVAQNRVIDDPQGSFTLYRGYLELVDSLSADDSLLTRLFSELRDLKEPSGPVYLGFELVEIGPFQGSKTDSVIKIKKLELLTFEQFRAAVESAESRL